MKETSPKNTQRQVANLIPTLELLIPLLKEVNKTQNNLSSLPKQLEYLKEQEQYFKLKASSQDLDMRHVAKELLHSAGNFKTEDIEIKLDFLVSDLESTLLNLLVLKDRISDLVVLRERVEALQEERLDNITPERIYKLLEQQNSSGYSEKSSSSDNPVKKLWHKLTCYKHFPKITKGMAITTGIILCFSAVSYSSMESQINETNTTQEIEETTEMPQDI
jgi:hypothetical protein